MALTMKLFYIAILICVTRVLSEDNGTDSTVAGPTGPSTAASPIAPGIPSDVCDGLNKTECCENATCAFSNCDDETGQAYKCTNASDITESCKYGNKTVDQCKAGATTVAPTTQATNGSGVSLSSAAFNVTETSLDNLNFTENSTASNGTSPFTTESPSNQNQKDICVGFDGASFVGGIVFCAGLLAIAAFLYKCYQSRQEQNYHNL